MGKHYAIKFKLHVLQPILNGKTDVFPEKLHRLYNISFRRPSRDMVETL